LGQRRSYTWSPDSKRLALTLGTTDCDYPGSANGVFITTLDRKLQTKASQGDMAFEPVFSPDGSSVAFVDFSDSPAACFARHHDRREVSHPASHEENNYYRLLDWR